MEIIFQEKGIEVCTMRKEQLEYKVKLEYIK